ncbi:MULTISPECIES: formate dehydrogenase accessory sulfurtransferase FdhD [Halomonadaceae]|jgi:FdhD protein|uniref:Sulfur carrier protein FdhD n=1 Tax=Vreelandella janggokensis TaxID=370767 RepID=A0ABT4IVY6_9GAMM|nr:MULTISPECIES: formate dehydrogenase accessory sulfurtransferase FdhD [Halomonas]MCW4150499.1 formate dehydrogenase accessory sulfurtransferase FdhD [Halomonas sp. 18H]MCZ0927127.1 formate dehydrogenase accessory sulfurtransferase FdhD [Halomonas janggokensis]MCZ0929635.1 formate dehydrogenase accessory sulfurtransferase FdhD [Halomonas janggokensis]MDR5886163.1 formate dehydrogenase accessory sulfurtransferase FdhD [Halomonas janggokensis]QPL45723.1 formate dehydrogenase accessory sulfurtra
MPALELSRARLPATTEIDVVDEFGDTRRQAIAAERALTVYLNKREIVTLMTLGDDPEALVVGYLRNQGLLRAAADLSVVQVDWEVEAAVVVTGHLPDDLEARLSTRTVTTGCGQGTVFGKLLDQTDLTELPDTRLAQSTLYQLLQNLNAYNETYRSAGAVHGCALCWQSDVLDFVEDVGRHNAVDTLAGRQWLQQADSADADIFYTTGRLTSEMVLKVAQMGISVLVSRSGVTQKGVELAKRFGVMLIARAKGKHFQAINAQDRLTLDAIPARPPRARAAKQEARQ